MTTHTPVLLRETVGILKLQSGIVVLDATLGTGGHGNALLDGMKQGVFVGLDADAEALALAKKSLQPPKRVVTHFIEGNFRDIERITAAVGCDGYDRILADLGWGSHQIGNGRGFSFMREESLNMCYSTREDGCDCTALTVVNSFSKKELTDIIRVYGEERWTARIVNALLDERKNHPIVTTTHLAAVVADAIPRRFHPKRIHPATKTFQAIRIAVNDELGALKQFLSALPNITNPNARAAIITFHSAEDRIVKQTFRMWETDGLGERGEKKAVRASREEIADNPRSRSAKLRTFLFT